LVYVVYVNLQSEIEKNIVKRVDLDHSILSKERLLYLIQTHKGYTPTTKYKFMNGLLYNVEVSDIPLYLEEESNNLSFTKEFSMIDDLCIKPSFPIFHSLNSIYLFFKETPVRNKGVELAKVKSILKTGDASILSGPQKTKRVRIQDVVSLNKSKKKRISLDSE
jgi:hypothetical protein